MYKRVASLIVAFALSLALLVGLPAATKQSTALAIGETVAVTSQSSVGTQIRVWKNGTYSYIGILPGGRITYTGRISHFYLPRGRCVWFTVDGNSSHILNGNTRLSSWVWISFGAQIRATFWRCTAT